MLTVLFQLTHPARGATDDPIRLDRCGEFQLTHPARGATPRIGRTLRPRRHFNSRTPRGVRLLNSTIRKTIRGYFNSRTPRGVRPALRSATSIWCAISTHAPREGCDFIPMYRQHLFYLFQLTHPARGATRRLRLPVSRQHDFNSRTPRGVRHEYHVVPARRGRISTHAPREGCDVTVEPVRKGGEKISTHAPREGCDQTWIMLSIVINIFQLTHPARGATLCTHLE